MSYDGSVIFYAGLDNSELEKDLGGLKNKIEKTNLKVDVDVPQAEKNLRAAMDRMDETSRKIKELQRQVDGFSGDKNGSEFSGLLSLLDQKKAEYRAAELAYRDAFDRVNGRGKYRAAPAEVLDAQEIQKKIDSFAAGASPELNRMRKELEEAENALKALESKGRWFGDADFDKAYQKLALIKQEIKEYKAELTTPAKPANPFGLDTLAGKIREAELLMKHLVEKGKGLGDADYNAAYREFALLKAEEAALKKQLAASAAQESDHLREIADGAQVANQHIVSLNEELAQLKARQKELEQANVGLVIKKALDAVEQKIREFFAAVQKGASAIWNAGSTLAGWLSDGIKSAKEFGSTAVSAFTAAAKSLVKLMADMNVLTKLSDAVGKKLQRLGQMIRRVFVFSVITKGLRAIRSQISAYLGLNEQLTVALRRLQGVLLTAFQPIYDVVVPALTTLVNVLSRVIAAISQFFAALFGTTAKKAQANAKALYGQTKALKATGAAAKEAGEEAEEAIGSLAGFDEINTIETEKKSGGGGSGGGGGEIDTGPLFDWEYDETPFDSWGEAFSAFLDKLLAGLPKLEAAFKKFADWLNDLAKKLYDMFTFPGVLDKVKALGKGLAEALNKLVNWIDWEMLGRALGAGLNLALNFLTSFLYAFDWMNLGQKLAEFVNGLVDEIDWYEFGRLLWAGFKIALETLAGFLLGLDMPLMAEAASNTIKGFFDEMYNTIERIPWFRIGAQIASFLNNIDWYGCLSSAIKAIQAALMAMEDAIRGFVLTMQWSDIAQQIYTAINDSFGRVDWSRIGRTLGDAFVHIFDFVREIVSGIDWHQIGENIADLILGFDFVSALSSLGQLIAAGITAAAQLACGFLDKVGPELRGIAEGIANGIRESIEAVDWSWVGEVVGRGIKGALAFVAGLLDPETFYAIGKAIGDFLVGLDWVGIVGGLAEVLANAIKSAVAAMSGFMDSVEPHLEEIATGIAEKINQFLRDVDWEELGRTISRGIELALDFLIDVVEQLDWTDVGNAIGDLLSGIDWSGIFERVCRLIADVFGAKLLAKIISLPDLIEAGIEIVAGLIKGIGQAVIGIGTLLYNSLIKPLVDAVKDRLGIHSPSTVFAEIGEDLVAGLLQGVKDAWDGILEFFKGGVDAIKEFFSSAWDTVKQKTSESWNAIKETVSGIWDSIKEKAGTIFDGIKEKIGGVWDGLKEKTSTIWDGIKTTLHALWDGLKEKVSTIWDGIKEKINTVWDNIKGKTSSIWGNIKTTLSTTWDNLKTWAKEKFDSIKTTISTAWDNVKAKTTEIWNNIKTTLSGLWNELKTTASTVFTEIKNKISEIWDNVKTAAAQKWEEIKTTVKGKWEAIRDEAKAKFEEVRSKISEAWDNIKRDIPGKLDGIKSAIQEKWNGIVSSAKKWGGDLCDNLASGIEGAIGTVKRAAQGVADRVSEYLHFSEPDVGPLSDFHTYMPDMLKLMAKGIRDNTHLAVSAASDLADSIANTVSGKSIGVDMDVPDISKFSIPLVAQGAKLPTSREFTMVMQGGTSNSDSLSRMEKLMENMLERMDKMEIVIHNETKFDGKTVTRDIVRHINDMTRSAGRPVIDF